MDDILFCTNEQLCDEMEDCGDEPDRSAAHFRADEILVVALLRACDDDLTHDQVARLIASWRKLEKWYA